MSNKKTGTNKKSGSATQLAHTMGLFKDLTHEEFRKLHSTGVLSDLIQAVKIGTLPDRDGWRMGMGLYTPREVISPTLAPQRFGQSDWTGPKWVSYLQFPVETPYALMVAKVKAKHGPEALLMEEETLYRLIDKNFLPQEIYSEERQVLTSVEGNRSSNRFSVICIEGFQRTRTVFKSASMKDTEIDLTIKPDWLIMILTPVS